MQLPKIKISLFLKQSKKGKFRDIQINEFQIAGDGRITKATKTHKFSCRKRPRDAPAVGPSIGWHE